MKKVDVIIVGSGIAGLRAGIACLENGLDVLILEKMNKPGGNTSLSDGGVAAAGSDLQKKRGIEDSVKRLKQDMLTAGKGLNDEALVDVVARGALEAFEWTKAIGVPYMDRIDIFGGHSTPRCYTPESLSGRTMIQKASERFEALGGRVETKTYVSELLKNDKGRIHGVKAHHPYAFNKPLPEQTKFFKAKKGVIIASGGFSADMDFLKLHTPELSDSIDTTNIRSATAEVLKSALSLGADARDLDQISLAPWTSPDEKGFGDGPKFADYVALPTGILISPNTASRFINELSDRNTISHAILNVGTPAVAIADETAVKNADMNLDKALKKGVVKTFDDLDTLSDHYKLDTSSLKETIHAFNESVEKKHDAAYGKPLENATPIKTPPYYAMRIWPKVHYTMGGLRIDANARVLKKDGSLMEGLFAAGEVTGGVHGAARLGSLGLTDCLVMGNIAANSIIEQ